MLCYLVFRVAIRDMVVRGAPAIAIAAALSLAVEVFNFETFSGTSEDAASFLVKKLEYLVSRYFILLLSSQVFMTNIIFFSLPYILFPYGDEERMFILFVLMISTCICYYVTFDSKCTKH